jgi:small subunit ribosomal protein S7
MEQKNLNNLMSRKKQAPKRIFYPDAKYGSLTLAKFINFVMYDGKKTTSEKIIYDALDKIREKTKDDPIKVFNEAIVNIRPNLEVRSRRVGGATYQVPQEVKTNRSQTLALRWLLDASRKRKNKTMSDKLFNELMDASQKKGSAIKKREDTHKMAESNKAFAHYRW